MTLHYDEIDQYVDRYYREHEVPDTSKGVSPVANQYDSEDPDPLFSNWKLGLAIALVIAVSLVCGYLTGGSW